MARGRQQLRASMVMLGINRIVVASAAAGGQPRRAGKKASSGSSKQVLDDNGFFAVPIPRGEETFTPYHSRL